MRLLGIVTLLPMPDLIRLSPSFEKNAYFGFFSLNPMKYFYLIIFLAWCFSCAEKKTGQTDSPQKRETAPKSTAETVQALPPEQTDSLLIRQQLQKYNLDSTAISKVIRFYADTVGNHYPYALIWSKRGTMHALASMFVNLVNHAQDDGLPMREYYSEDLERIYLQTTDSVHAEKITGKPLRQELDVLLTASFLNYAPRLWKGQIEPSKADWFIPGKSLDYNRILLSLLDGRLSFKTFEPLHREYGLLRKALQTYRQIAKAGGWPLLPAGPYQNLAKKADKEEVFALKKRLQLTQDIPQGASTDSTFNEQLTQGLQKFQQRHGLAATGTLTAKTLAQLNVPVEQRINQILLNMERWRWVPAGKTGTYLGINIPEFVLHVFENSRQVWQMDVIVGKTATATPIFDDEIEYVVLNPTWGVPRSIAVNEVLPKLRADSNYLQNHQMELFAEGSQVAMNPEQIDWKNITASNFRYSIRQRPGSENPLGRIKFLLPNSYDIYLHDTPGRGMFNRSERGFSHGCIRLSDPFRLQAYLMKADSLWTPAKVQQVLKEGKEKYIKLKRKIPVFIAYFTAWEDSTGRLQFREDIYGHDARLAADLFQQPDQALEAPIHGL